MLKFKVFATAFLTVVLGATVAAGISATSDHSPVQVDADTITGGVALYMKPNNYWTQANARFAAYFCNGSSAAKWYDMHDDDGDGVYKVVVSTGESHKNVIFVRMNPSTTANNWNSDVKWNQTSDLTWPGGTQNLYTIKANTWDKGGGTWSVYTEPTSEYTVTYKDPITSSILGTETFVEGVTWNSKFIEKEGYRLEGWYTDSKLTTEFAKGTAVTKDLTLYAKYVAAENYRILVGQNFFTLSESTNPTMYYYAYRDALDGGYNASWPGESLASVTKFDYYYVIEIDASKSFDTIIFSAKNSSSIGDKYQTEDLVLSFDDLTAYNIVNDDTSNKKKATAEFNAYSLSYKIWELGGEWDYHPEEKTANCETNYTTATNLYNSLSADAKKDFQTSEVEEIVNARTRYQMWAAANGNLNPFNGGSSALGLFGVLATQQNSSQSVGVIILVILLVSLTGFIVIKRRKQSSK